MRRVRVRARILAWIGEAPRPDSDAERPQELDATAARGAVPWSGRPFDPKSLSRMLDAVADSSVRPTLAS